MLSALYTRAVQEPCVSLFLLEQVLAQATREDSLWGASRPEYHELEVTSLVSKARGVSFVRMMLLMSWRGGSCLTARTAGSRSRREGAMTAVHGGE